MKLEERIERIEELKNKINELYNTDLKNLFIDFAYLEKPFFVLIEGYTPFFNDGSPCEHTAYYSYGLGDIEDFYSDFTSIDDIPDLFKYLNKSILEDYLKLLKSYNDIEYQKYLNIKKEFDIKYFAQIDNVELIILKLIIPILEMQYKTNFRVSITCINGVVNIIHEEYVDHD